MTEIKLKLKKESEFPLEADVITPDQFTGKTLAEIKKLTVFHGNEEKSLGDFFDISGKSGQIADLKIIS